MLAPGEIFGHYRIEEELGGGAFGTVFRGEDVRLHRKVAIKVLKARAEEDPEAWGRLLEEARAASALNHPNIFSTFTLARNPASTILRSNILRASRSANCSVTGRSRLSRRFHMPAR